MESLHAPARATLNRDIKEQGADEK